MSSATPVTSSRCDDSVLSIVANIAGVLTFVYAITAGVAFYYHSYRNSARDTKELLTYLLDSEFEIISPPSDFWSVRGIMSTEEGRELRRTQENAATEAYEKIKNLERLASRSLKSHSKLLRLQGRGRFVLSRQKLMEKRAEVDSALQSFRSETIRFVQIRRF
ncbi:MAG: hypothetical protein L6R38_006080 [Xanthoria sp. 2 TBL-2021]|nr:MAG: hypothetical protein L6R38_006080 [Xanthoria sp. 2 TBL-2021]